MGEPRRWLREPLLHFVVLGLLVFGADRWIGSAPERVQIVVSEQQVARLSALWERQWRRPPSAAELDGLVADHVREEILYREAMRLGLDEDDTVIRRRLAQKLAFVSEDRAVPDAPAEADLRAYFDAHAPRYRRPARYSLTQIPFTSDRPELSAEDAARQALEVLSAAQPPALMTLGDASMLPRQVQGWTPREVSAEFGGDFADALVELAPGRWHGPVKSAFGLHLVRIDAYDPPREGSLEEARREVSRDWLEQRRREANDAFYAELLDRYEVEVEVEGIGPASPAR